MRDWLRDSPVRVDAHRPESMPNVTSVITRAIRKRLDWNTIGIAISVLIVTIAVVILVRLLRDIDVDKVIDALRAKSIEQISIAGAFVAVAYLALTFYDFFALRTIGRGAVPYRIAALASFTAYTIGHNLGATVFTAGVIRLRIYSAWGLNIIDIAKIAFVTGLTFWLGNAFVLGAGMAYAPAAASAVNQLPPWVNRTIGVAGLMTIVAYLLWLMPRRRLIGRSSWQIALPSPRSTLLQIGIGIWDLGAGAIAVYALLPDYPAVDFTVLLVVFVIAILLGFVSHAPGSLGVIEATMLVGLPEFPKEELLASLLIFRFLYFIVPLSFAAILLGLRELRFIAGSAATVGERKDRWLRKRAPSDCDRTY
jgi:glycosyltransferase 2 family protein